MIIDQGTVLGEDVVRMPLSQQRGQLPVALGGAGFVAGDDLQLAAAQTRRDLQPRETGDQGFRLPQGLGQPRLGQAEHPDGLLPVDGAARDRLLRCRGLDGAAPHRPQLAGRPGKHDHCRRTAGPGDDDARRRADGIEDLDTLGAPARRHQRLLTVGRPYRLEVGAREAAHEGPQDLGDALLERFVEHQLAATEPGHDGDRHVVGRRPEATARDDQVDTLCGKEIELGLDVLGPVTADGDVREFDT
ncbi:Uncharacterised protein [Mycobacteroides abscessus subsp. abscessus]|nr:Uncharacterised protein [Mycobacteroides abscessus subsp. abscessus]